MPLETSAAAGGYLVNIGVVGIAGTLFGLPLDALILGGLTGAVVQGLRPASTRRAGFFPSCCPCCWRVRLRPC